VSRAEITNKLTNTWSCSLYYAGCVHGSFSLLPRCVKTLPGTIIGISYATRINPAFPVLRPIGLCHAYSPMILSHRLRCVALQRNAEGCETCQLSVGPVCHHHNFSEMSISVKLSTLTSRCSHRHQNIRELYTSSIQHRVCNTLAWRSQNT